MPGRGQELSRTTRQRISSGLRRYHNRRREEAQVRPAHVHDWLREGIVHHRLRPFVKARAAMFVGILQDLGGSEVVTGMQKGILEGWLQAQVAADAAFARFVTTDDSAALVRLATFLNTSRSALIALGLERRARDVTPNLEDYLAQREAAQTNPHGEIGGAQDPEVPVDGDRGGDTK